MVAVLFQVAPSNLVIRPSTAMLAQVEEAPPENLEKPTLPHLAHGREALAPMGFRCPSFKR